MHARSLLGCCMIGNMIGNTISQKEIAVRARVAVSVSIELDQCSAVDHWLRLMHDRYDLEHVIPEGSLEKASILKE